MLEKSDIFQEMFAEIDKEDDGIIYVRDVIFYLKAMNDDMENKKVNYNPEHGFSLHLLFLHRHSLTSSVSNTLFRSTYHS